MLILARRFHLLEAGWLPAGMPVFGTRKKQLLIKEKTMRAHYSTVLRASLLACVCAGTMFSGVSRAAAQTAEVGFFANRGWGYYTSSDVIGAATTHYGEYYLHTGGWVSDAPVSGLSGRSVLPGGMWECWMDQQSYAGWDGPNDTFEVSSTVAEIPVDSNFSFGIDLPVTKTAYAGPVTVTRQISDAVLTGDIQTRTVTATVDVTGSLSGYDVLHVQLPEWSQAEGISTAITSSTYDNTNFFAGGEGFVSTNPGALSGLYTFEMTVDITRSGQWTQAQTGDLFYKPGIQVNYGNQTPWTQTTDTTREHNFGDGMIVTIEAGETVNFNGQRNYNTQNLSLEPVIAVAGSAAAPTQIFLTVDKMTSITGLETHEFWCSVEGENMVGGSVTRQGGTTYEMVCDRYEGDSGMEFYVASTNASELAEFTTGTYIVKVLGDDGNTQTFSIDLTGETPTDSPTFDQPMGFETTDPRPTVTWSASADPDVNFAVSGMEASDFEEEVLLGAGDPRSFTPSRDLEQETAFMWAGFLDFVSDTVDAAEGTADGVPFMAGYTAFTQSYISVVPEPASIMLLAAGAIGLVRRGRK